VTNLHEQHALLVIVQWLQYVWFVTEIWLPYIYLKISMVCFQLDNYYLPSPIPFSMIIQLHFVCSILLSVSWYLFWLAFWMCNGIGFNNIMIIYVLEKHICSWKCSSNVLFEKSKSPICRISLFERHSSWCFCFLGEHCCPFFCVFWAMN
jgi:hypothetical protein